MRDEIEVKMTFASPTRAKSEVCITVPVGMCEFIGDTGLVRIKSEAFDEKHTFAKDIRDQLAGSFVVKRKQHKAPIGPPDSETSLLDELMKGAKQVAAMPVMMDEADE